MITFIPNKWPIRRRILVLPGLFALGFILLLLANVVLERKMFREVIFPNYNNQLINGHQRTLKSLVDAEAIALGERVRPLNTREEKIAAIIADTDPIRFFDNNSGYFFTYQLDGVRINVPVNKADNGKNLLSLKDANGVKIVEDFISKAKAGGGFTEYYYDKPGQGIQPKLSYSKLIPGTDILVGTGVYTDDVQREQLALEGLIQKSNTRFMAYKITVFGLLLVVVVLASVFTARAISRLLVRIITSLAAGTEQVTAAAGQVSASSQSLAEGSSEQAASLEEASSSLEEMSSMTKRNSENAQKANDLAKQARAAADKGTADMQTMNAAMTAIKVSSDDIAKIIKTVDEIAFQTNILALNAAVEAARAGEAGMGFAVVADEVRNLAQRSAQAAKETAAKIEGAIAKTAQGVGISQQVSTTLNEIAIKARQVDELAAEVAGASREQTQGITQINTAVGQMDRVTQSNAANAEESAASAQELNAQAITMQQSVAELLQLVGGEQLNRPAISDHRHESRGIITWDEARMATGVSTVDEQHQELIELINALHTACLAGKASEELMDQLNFLGNYVQSHFAQEENIMEQHHCPARGQNKAAHAKFLQDYERVVALVKENGASSRAALELKRMLGDWLSSHICRIDVGLRSCRAAHSNQAGVVQRRHEPPLNADHKDF